MGVKLNIFTNEIMKTHFKLINVEFLKFISRTFLDNLSLEKKSCS